MTDENSGRFNLSRRKALAGIGSIGAAVGLGGIGTYAQFSDTEENTVTFTAGGIDGEISWAGSYNGSDKIDGSNPNVDLGPIEVQGGSITTDVHFKDVKPGDFGCVNFGITVANNPAWVASCLNITQDKDYLNYDAEVEADDDIDTENVEFNSAGEASYDGSSGGRGKDGELDETIYTIPYYDSDNDCLFFDPGDPFDTSDYDGATPSAFWSNSQEDGAFVASTSDPDEPISVKSEDEKEYYLVPRSLRDVNDNVQAVDTAHWSAGNNNDSTLEMVEAPDGATVGSGCVMLDGNATEEESSGNNTQGVAPLEPGDRLNFGYDFHMPFGVGNVAQGDRLTLELGFVFLQTRHTQAPQFGEFAPAKNTPGGT